MVMLLQTPGARVVLQDKLRKKVYQGADFYMKCKLGKFGRADNTNKLLGFHLLMTLLTIFCSWVSSWNNVNLSTVFFCDTSIANHDPTQ